MCPFFLVFSSFSPVLGVTYAIPTPSCWEFDHHQTQRHHVDSPTLQCPMTFSWLNLWPWSIAVSWFPFFWWDRWYVNHPIGSIYHLYTTYSPCHMILGYLGKFYLQKHDGISWQISPTKTWWGCFSKLFGLPIRSHTNGKKILHQFKTS